MYLVALAAIATTDKRRHVFDQITGIVVATWGSRGATAPAYAVSSCLLSTSLGEPSGSTPDDSTVGREHPSPSPTEFRYGRGRSAWVVPVVTLAQQLEQLAGLGIFVVGTALLALSLVAWRRERESRMLIVSVAYALFAIHGLVVFLEYYVLAAGLLAFEVIELVEHTSSFLVLFGLLAFFVAITRD